MISVGDAQSRLSAILAAHGQARPETISISDAVGRVLAQDVFARRDQPPFASSAMDGYAVRWGDIENLPATLKIVGTAQAGKRYSGKLLPGETVRILTGAPVPDDADTVVVQEDVMLEKNSIIVNGRPENRAGHIRRAGLDCAAGRLLAAAGTWLSPALTCLIAAGAVSVVSVGCLPRVDLVMCGDELRLSGQPLGADQIVSTNGLMLATLMRDAGARVVGADNIIPDDLDALTSVFRNSDADIIVTAGGASVGDKDFVQAAILAAGGKLDFWKIAMRPGKPLMIGTLGQKLIVGLPGNPVSAFVGALLFAVPAVRALQGQTHPFPALHAGTWGGAQPENGPRDDYVRVRLERGPTGPIAHGLSVQDSSMLSVLAAADALAVRPAHEAARSPGDPMLFLPLPYRA
jgi:molybdopterin molybdotransferase